MNFSQTIASPDRMQNAAGVPLHRPEVLSPAGNWMCARAAVENGADAIYFGVGRFNARVRADNFTDADLPELMAFLHRRGVRGYVTFNTLIFGNELTEAVASLRAIIAAGVDAAIVQDVGICRLIRRISPDFPIHASTQMTVTSDAGVAFTRELGASLAVLARECSIPEMMAMQQKLASDKKTMPLEVFVHGALCVAYSGQCLTSESLGGRSANRGECAQACRLPYDLVCDGKQVPLGDRKYLLSPQDLAGLEVIPELIRAGVSSLKIEGRLKSPEYVAAITRAYRTAVDRIYASMTKGAPDDAGAMTEAVRIRRETDYDLEMSFSRGLDIGWLHGIDNRRLVHARFGKKRGVFLGVVEGVQEGRVRIKLEAPVKPGDGVVFDEGKPEEGEEGGFVHGVDPQRDGTTWVRMAREALDWHRIRSGQRLWKTSDPELTKRLRNSYAGEKPHFRRPVNIRVWGETGATLRGELDELEGHVVSGESAIPLVAAEKQPLTETVLRDQLGRLGGTPFELGTLSTSLDGAVMLPLGELNRMRRELAERLNALRATPLRWALNETVSVDVGAETLAQRKKASASAMAATLPEIIPVVRLPEQLDAALRWGAKTIYCEFEDPKKYRDAVAQVRQFSAGAEKPVEIWVMPPRIFKQGEDWILKQVRSCEADGYLARNHEHLHYFSDCRCRGDFSLNVANPLAAEYFMETFGLERLTASYDLNATQLDALLTGVPPDWVEVTLHQHMPMFHMEHCVFCSFLSKGKDYHDCGRPCEKHTVRLRDRVGAEHLLRADAGCRNTVFNARAQTGAEFADRLLVLGVRHFRVEFVDESPDTILKTLNRYAALLRGEISGSQLWRELKLQNQLGVTRGTLLER
ncbi:MAG: U32 family peptidase [Puniceicoccales bacterium]|jgi:putative protease|nr:U32 family peptidase [Puniceicoccales bacterium]